ncbi:hypothetical protein ES703_87802 [subsurface metagenome]
MGRVDFRTGDLTGKLGGMVGARWKQSPYTRKYVIPANPRTLDQVANRESWALLVAHGRRINSSVLKLFTFPKPKAMSPFNWFMHINKTYIDMNLDVPSDMVISQGGLFIKPITSLVASKAAGTVVVVWPVELEGEALDTDVAICVAWNEAQDTYGFSTTIERSVGTCDITLDGDVDDEAHVWMFFTQGDKINSGSPYKDVIYVA